MKKIGSILNYTIFKGKQLKQLGLPLNSTTWTSTSTYTQKYTPNIPPYIHFKRPMRVERTWEVKLLYGLDILCSEEAKKRGTKDYFFITLPQKKWENFFSLQLSSFCANPKDSISKRNRKKRWERWNFNVRIMSLLLYFLLLLCVINFGAEGGGGKWRKISSLSLNSHFIHRYVDV